MHKTFFLLFCCSSVYVLAQSNGAPIAATLENKQKQGIKQAPSSTENNSSLALNEEETFEEDEFEEDEFEDFDEEFEEQDAQIDEVFDPLSGYNRWMTGVNDDLMIYVVEPVSDGYGYVVPTGGRQSVNNFFRNLYYPVSLVNNVCQLEVKDSGTETLRFLINSTLGLLGLFDPAKEWFEIEPHVEDFGQTLGYYGVGSGFPVVLPFFGQNNLRDLTGSFADAFADPIFHVENRFYNTVDKNWQSVGIKGYDDFNEYSLTPGAYPALTEDSIDLYPFLRDAYEQHRNQLIKE